MKERLIVGTNFYLFSLNKNICDKYFDSRDYARTETPYVGYQIHIAKTSAGWLPLFEAHKGLTSIDDLYMIYRSGDFEIYDEYGTLYDWNGFTERVLKFNGGRKGVISPISYKEDIQSPFYDKDMPTHIPVSHFEYASGKYAEDYFKDPDGYEFTWGEFS